MQITTGFTNWKDGVAKFRQHEQSEHHREAHEEIYILPKQVRDIGEHLDSAHASEKLENRKALSTILRVTAFLARQGLPLRGDGDEKDSNFNQLLLFESKENSNISNWLTRRRYKYTSKDIQNEILHLMSAKILEGISSSIQKANFYTVMADESTDASNKEQVVIVIRWVDKGLNVHEDFVRLHQVDNTNAETIAEKITTSLNDMNLNVHQMRGQCYDGASVMSGLKTGVATRIQQLESRAIYTHCYGHSLNLAAGDTIKNSTVMKKALDITLEMSKLIKFSPKRDALFQKLKGELQPECPGMRVLCPTRWTVRADSLKSVLDNYSVLQELWEESVKVTKESELTARIVGVSSQMATFDFYFGVYIGEMILRHSDNLSRTLQKKDISAAEGQHVASLVMTTLKSMRSDASFKLFWQVLAVKAQKLNIGEPTLPRKRKVPRRFEIGDGEAEFHANVEDHYRSIYYEALDLIIQCIDDRFDQAGYRIYVTLEALLLKGCKQEEHASELDIVKELYEGDVNFSNLEVQFQTIAAALKDDISLSAIVQYLVSLSEQVRSIYSEIVVLVELILVMPATNATSERSFSALRRIKTYLRTTMSQQRLNDLMILYVHRDSLDELDMDMIGENFVAASSEPRATVFGHFIQQ